MDENDLHRLVRLASELQEFEALAAAGESEKEEVRDRARAADLGQSGKFSEPAAESVTVRPMTRARGPRRPLVVLAAAAVLLLGLGLALFWPTPFAIESVTLRPLAFRGEEGMVELLLVLSKPGYVSVVMVDAGHERWLMPIAEADDAHHKPVEGRTRILLPLQPGRERGARAVYVLVIASREPEPSTEELLAVIPDPVVAAEASRADVHATLEAVSGLLARRFGCTARVEAVPGE